VRSSAPRSSGTGSRDPLPPRFATRSATPISNPDSDEARGLRIDQNPRTCERLHVTAGVEPSFRVETMFLRSGVSGAGEVGNCFDNSQHLRDKAGAAQSLAFE
jgi:hypothetical protein